MGLDLKLNELEGSEKGKQAGIGDGRTGKGKKFGKAAYRPGTSANVKVGQSKRKELGRKKGQANPTGVGDDKSITKGKKKFGKAVDVPEPVSISQSKPIKLRRKREAKLVTGGHDKSNTKGKEKFGKAVDELGPMSINQSGVGAEKTPTDKGKSQMETDGLGTYIPAKEGKMMVKKSSSKNVLLCICEKNKIQLPIYNCTTNGVAFQATLNIGEVSYVGEWRKYKGDAERSAAQMAIDVFESEGIEKMLDVKFAKLKKQLNDLQAELYCAKEELMKANERVNKLEANINEANKTIIEYMVENGVLVQKISELNIVND